MFQEVSQARLRGDEDVFDLLNQLTDEEKRKRHDKLMELKGNFSVAHMFFKDHGIVKYSRDELYGIMDVIGKLDYIITMMDHNSSSDLLSSFFSCVWGNCWSLYGLQFAQWR